MQLKREIEIRQAMVLEDRQLLAAHADSLRYRALQSLATPKALAGSFAAGLLLAILRDRRKRVKTDGEATAAGSPWLHLLLRDVAMPLALAALQTKLGGAAEQHADQQQ